MTVETRADRRLVRLAGQGDGGGWTGGRLLLGWLLVRLAGQGDGNGRGCLLD